MGNDSETFLEANSRDPDPLLEDLKSMVKAHSASHPRHAQVALGPSQVGHPCARNVIQGMLAGNEEVINPQFDCLPSYVGVAGHRHLEDAVRLDNEQYRQAFNAEHNVRNLDPDTLMHTLDTYQPRWFSERKVTVREGLSGTCDLYDSHTDTVIDFKFPGTTKMSEYRRRDKAGQPPSILYQIQAHLYGKGYRNEGYDVKRVGIWMLPRAGLLSTSLLWMEDYNEGLVQQQLSRLDDMMVLMHDMDLERQPERLALIPITPYDCGWCPFFTTNPARMQDNPYACAGGEDYQPTISNHSGMTPPGVVP